DGEQVHVVLLTLVAGGGELGVAARRRIDEPAPAGGVVVEVDGIAGGLAERQAAEVGDLNLDAADARRVNAGGLPPADRFEEQRPDRVGAEGLVRRLGGQVGGRQPVAAAHGE